MPKQTAIASLEDSLERIERNRGRVERLVALVLQTASNPDLRDGLQRGGNGGPSATDENADVVLTSVEAAALRRDPNEHERKSALEVLATVAGADKMMGRAAELALLLEDRIPKQLRDVAEVTCVEDDCEKLRADGWDDARPNGKSGRCSSCYQRRQRSRRDG